MSENKDTVTKGRQASVKMAVEPRDKLVPISHNSISNTYNTFTRLWPNKSFWQRHGVVVGGWGGGGGFGGL